MHLLPSLPIAVPDLIRDLPTHPAKGPGSGPGLRE